uniref:Uncharacterized protein n=1 Tax=Anguilla anguilla TaxID=7936 RepID=A0A0E9WQ81_ANGAN
MNVPGETPSTRPCLALHWLCGTCTVNWKNNTKSVGWNKFFFFFSISPLNKMRKSNKW